MAKSIDRCVTDGCFCVAAKGLHICLGCWDNIFIDLMSGDSDSGPSMDECYGSGRSCEMGMCLNTPQEGETICASCWDKHDGADTPGFPSEYESDDQLGKCGTCSCGNSCVVTSYNRYNICLFCMRQLLDSFGRENKTDAEEALWEQFLPTEDMGWIDVEYAVQRWINVFFFSGDEYEYYIPQEEELTQCTDSCKEMGMMSEGCEFCE